jgi:hypothetical protein
MGRRFGVHCVEFLRDSGLDVFMFQACVLSKSLDGSLDDSGAGGFSFGCCRSSVNWTEGEADS